MNGYDNTYSLKQISDKASSLIVIPSAKKD